MALLSIVRPPPLLYIDGHGRMIQRIDPSPPMDMDEDI